jgi:glucokinase
MAIGLVGDIGGTNARFAFADSGGPGGLIDPVSVKCADYPDIASAIQSYLGRASGPMPTSAVLAVAGPLTGDRIRLTNGPWQFSIADLANQLELPGLRVVNDFVAMARGVALLPPDRITLIGGPAAEPSTSAGPWLVIGPGTGLGVAVIHDPSSHLRIHESEGGNAGFSPSDETDLDIASAVLRSGKSLTWERLVSGPGLILLHEILSDGAGHGVAALTPEEILGLGLENDSHCRSVLERFCGLLGTAAGDMALMTKSRRVYLTGGIVQTLLPFLRESDIRERFTSRGRYGDVLEDVPLFVALGTDLGLIGAADILKSGP